MGHANLPDRSYRLLREKLDRNVTGAPDSPALRRILRILFSPEDAELARKIPGAPTELRDLSRRLGVPKDRLGEKLSDMARRGLVIDLELKRRRYFSLSPIVIGFFEFTYMRAREDLPMTELSKLFWEYMGEDDRFARTAFKGPTQIGRTLVQEEALPKEGHTEILDWERATHIVKTAKAAAVSLCACRHHACHMGKACGKPQKVCLSLNYAAGILTRNGMAEPLTTAQAMKTLEKCKELGLAQTGDNVKRGVSYICNCCGCCCGMIHAIRKFDLKGAIVTSNWIMDVDASACKGCGKCVKACPVAAVSLQPVEGTKRKRARRDETLCLGCGVCVRVCKRKAAVMKPRSRRVLTPETSFDKTVAMAIERGKLAQMIFDDPERLSHRALGRVMSVLERSPLTKAVMAIAPLRSVFLGAIVRKAKEDAGGLAKTLE